MWACVHRRLLCAVAWPMYFCIGERKICANKSKCCKNVLIWPTHNSRGTHADIHIHPHPSVRNFPQPLFRLPPKPRSAKGWFFRTSRCTYKHFFVFFFLFRTHAQERETCAHKHTLRMLCVQCVVYMIFLLCLCANAELLRSTPKLLCKGSLHAWHGME